jgi:hypothetical protein
MGNPGGFPTASIPYPGGASTSINTGFLAHTTQPNPSVSPNFQQPYYQTMAYGPNVPPMGTGVPHGPIPNILFPRTLAYATPNPQVEGDNEGLEIRSLGPYGSLGSRLRAGLDRTKSHTLSTLT